MAIAAVLLAGAVLAVGCGGGNDDDPGSGDPVQQSAPDVRDGGDRDRVDNDAARDDDAPPDDAPPQDSPPEDDPPPPDQPPPDEPPDQGPVLDEGDQSDDSSDE